MIFQLVTNYSERSKDTYSITKSFTATATELTMSYQPSGRLGNTPVEKRTDLSSAESKNLQEMYSEICTSGATSKEYPTDNDPRMRLYQSATLTSTDTELSISGGREIESDQAYRSMKQLERALERIINVTNP